MDSRYLKAEEKAGKNSEARPKSLLLVEDEDKHAELIRKAFRESKSEWKLYRVATLKAALEWLREVETKLPFVVVADYRLPDGTGLDIAGEAKSPEELGFPLIIMTGQGSEQLAVRSFKSGAMDYMVKRTEWLQELPWTVERVLREWDTITERKAAVEALQESEERYRLLFENSVSAIVYYDTEGKCVLVNQQAITNFGEKAKDIIGKSLYDLFPKEVADFHLQRFTKIMNEGTGAEFEDALPLTDGEHWFSSNVQPVKDTSGKIIGILSISNDITKHKLAEDTLKDSEERFRMMFENMSNAVAVYEAVDEGTDFIFKDFNRAGEMIEGIKREDLIGKSVLEIFSGVVDSGLFGVIQRVWQTGISEHHPLSFYVDERIVGWRENYVYKLPRGEIVAIYEDVTERKRAEELIRNAEQDWRHSFNSLEDVMLMIDKDYNIEKINDEGLKLLGKCKEEVIGQKCYQVISGADSPSEDCPCIKSRETKKVESFDLYEKRSGKYFSVKNSPVFDEKGEIIKFVDIWRDISERKRMEMELEQFVKELEAKNAEMERFTYTVSHDLKAPLLTIQGFATLLQDDLKQDERENEDSYLRYIADGAKKMGHLLDDLLQLSRIGRVVNPPEDVPFGEIVREAQAQIPEQLKTSGLEIVVADDLPAVHVDHLRIAEMLVNLISNSINYMGAQPHPKIEIGYRVDGEETVFFVRDNGIGIEESEHEKVFELFYRVDNSINKGTGAGLAIVKRIVEVHGGRIWIESKAGKGCTVCFTLPFCS
jgi:PAS domain S-box-containing protein